MEISGSTNVLLTFEGFSIETVKPPWSILSLTQCHRARKTT